jgi:protein-export membrane protein SecD
MKKTNRIIGLITCFLLMCIDIAALAYVASRLVESRPGMRYGMKLVDESDQPVSNAEIQQTINIMRARLNDFNVDSPSVERSNTEGETIEVILPPLSELDRVLSLLNANSYIEWRPVPLWAQTSYPTTEAAEAAAKSMPGTPDQYEVVSHRQDREQGGYMLLERAALVTSLEIRDARARGDGDHYSVDFRLTPEARQRFAQWTGEHIGEHLAIVLNNEVKSAPIIQAQIQGWVQITGSFTKQEAEDFALVLKSGPLPRKVMYVSEAATTSNRWSRKYVILTGVFALAFVLLIAIFYYVFKARLTLQDDARNLWE